MDIFLKVLAYGMTTGFFLMLIWFITRKEQKEKIW